MYARIVQVARRLQDDRERFATLFQADVMIRVFTIQANITMSIQRVEMPCNRGNSYHSNNFGAVFVMSRRVSSLVSRLAVALPGRI